MISEPYSVWAQLCNMKYNVLLFIMVYVSTLQYLLNYNDKFNDEFSLSIEYGQIKNTCFQRKYNIEKIVSFISLSRERKKAFSEI